MKTDLFHFDLPADRIALRPVTPRDAARLLVVRPGQAGEFEDRKIADLPDLLHAGDALVVNDSKVIAARLKGRRIGRGTTEPEIEATLHKRIDGSHWRAFILGAKKVQVGDTLRFGDEGKVCFLNELDAQVSQKHEGGEVTLSFSFHGPVLDQAIAERGDMPLPPYIASRRAPDEQDRADYQTLFAQAEGSVAAPTAGLHFTESLLNRGSPSTASAFTKSRCMSAPAPSCRSNPTTPKATRCMPNSARCRPRWRTRSTPCGPKAGASWRSARPRCGFWKVRPARMASSKPFPAKRRSSSRRATTSKPST